MNQMISILDFASFQIGFDFENDFDNDFATTLVETSFPQPTILRFQLAAE